MKKILFTDLYGTLVSPHSTIAQKYFGSFDREFLFVSQFLNEFLSDGNYVVIVTEPGAHDKFGKVFNEILAKINSYIREDLRSHIVYYLQGKGKILTNDHINKENRNGKTCYIGEYPFIGIAVDKKEEAVCDFLQDIQKPYQIYGIGDSYKDVPMLLKVKEIGGISSIMDTYLYRYEYGDGERTIDDIIQNQLKIEFDFQYQQVLNNIRLEGREYDGYDEQEMLLLEKREIRKKELYQLLFRGELDLDALNRNYSNHEICLDYELFDSPAFKKQRNFYESYPFNEEVEKSIMQMPCYASFGEYYKKVLKKY